MPTRKWHPEKKNEAALRPIHGINLGSSLQTNAQQLQITTLNPSLIISTNGALGLALHLLLTSSPLNTRPNIFCSLVAIGRVKVEVMTIMPYKM